MNWYSQLTQLLLDYYREDPTELRQLGALQSCKLSRRWGTLHVNCRDRQVADSLVAAGHLLKEPVAQLRLAQQIRILFKGTLVSALPVNSPSQQT
jgi:hypothetical protein